jgi:hypothetical protein
MSDSEELSKKLDRILFGQAQLSLRIKFPGDKQLSLKDILEEQSRLQQDFIERHTENALEHMKYRRLTGEE